MSASPIRAPVSLWLALLLLGGCGGGGRAISSIGRLDGSYYLPVEANYQNTMFRAWSFTDGRITEEMVDRHGTVQATTAVGTYTWSEGGCSGTVEGRRYRFAPRADGDLDVTLLQDEPVAVSIRLMRRADE